MQYLILGQIILPLNITENFDKYQCKSDEVKFVIPLYDSETGELKGIDAKWAYIMVRWYENEYFSPLVMMKLILIYLFRFFNEHEPNGKITTKWQLNSTSISNCNFVISKLYFNMILNQQRNFTFKIGQMDYGNS